MIKQDINEFLAQQESQFTLLELAQFEIAVDERV